MSLTCTVCGAAFNPPDAATVCSRSCQIEKAGSHLTLHRDGSASIAGEVVGTWEKSPRSNKVRFVAGSMVTPFKTLPTLRKILLPFAAKTYERLLQAAKGREEEYCRTNSGPTVDRFCETCVTPFADTPSSERRFCSSGCRKAKRSEGDSDSPEFSSDGTVRLAGRAVVGELQKEPRGYRVRFVSGRVKTPYMEPEILKERLAGLAVRG